MSTTKIEHYLQQCISRRKIPGAVCLIAKNKKIVLEHAFGWAQRIPRKSSMTKDTIFDLASLTKPIATASLTLILYERKMLKLTDRVEYYLPEFRYRPNHQVDIKQLLTHTSGLPAWFPLYIVPAADRIKFLADINTGKQNVLYSCLGYILLGMIIEKITGQDLAISFKEFIANPLSLLTMRFGPINSNNVAVAENGNKHEAGMAKKYTDKLPRNWRSKLIKGTVHDGNAYYAFNGVAGNAGLFSTAKDILKFLFALPAGKLIKPSTCKLMIKDHTGGAEKRGLGWIINPYPGILSKQAYYHTGFTGTMAGVDPVKKLIIILLANAIHPRVQLNIMRPIRKQIVRLAADL
ncbi:hypothetical protein A2Y85_00560 [candidate division WOR-3 bacterium RBG_13_43_14]|uniref:Beta-lactamase-related domain-containing protein n=1 Tax=candidate division WOR-3 bacterium RBG_13_43_14 TaxID=1802590 RepID=A0A1F4UEE3_UNCW3|nr:MAG: hypothetical protein A2Y85_00560 [candidate division WOR-3 bacterium RBG_13_43_14]